MRPTWGYAPAYRGGETPAVYALLAVMGIAFLLDFFWHGTLTVLGGWLTNIVWLKSGEFWRPFTFPFVHATNFLYIVTDGLVLYWFGGSLERAWGSGKFLFFFFASGIFAGLVELLLSLRGGGGFLFGMVGSFVGCVVAFAALNPYATVLFFFFPLQARWLAVISIAFEVFGRTSIYGGAFPAVITVGATVVFAYFFTVTRFSLRPAWGRGPSLRDRYERWQQRRRMRQWQRRVARVERPEDLFKDKK